MDRRAARANEYDPAYITFNLLVERSKHEADNFSSVQREARRAILSIYIISQYYTLNTIYYLY